MPSATWSVGILVIIGCNGANESEPRFGTRYDVTERGVVASALDPGGGEFDEPAAVSADWLEYRVGTPRQTIYLPRTGRAPDLSYYQFGRSGVRYPTRETTLALDLGGVDWHMSDSLQIVAPNVGAAIHDVEVHFAYPTEGTKQLDRRMNWLNAGAPLIEAARGDTTWVTQMSATTMTGGGFYSVLSRAGTSTSVEMADGGDASLQANLAPVARDRSFDLRWKGGAYAALASQAGPYAKPGKTAALSIRTLPRPLIENNNFHQRFYMYLPSLVDFGPVHGDADNEETVRYGNPFSTTTMPWGELLTVVYSMPIVIPNGGVTYAMAVQATPVEALAGGAAITPQISPVRNVQIDGVSAEVERTSSASPTISWDAPALGTATSYAVAVQAIVPAASGGKTVVTTGTFYTTSTSITIPSKALAGVDSFVLAINAISSKDRNFAATPFLGALPYASAEYVTAKQAVTR
jgi:hypothetical protein